MDVGRGAAVGRGVDVGRGAVVGRGVITAGASSVLVCAFMQKQKLDLEAAQSVHLVPVEDKKLCPGSSPAIDLNQDPDAEEVFAST